MNRSKVDFWAWRVGDDLPAIDRALQGVFAGAPAEVQLKSRGSGWKGYESCSDVLVGDMAVGMVAYGGDGQRGWAYVGISGRGCDWVKDWDLAQEAASTCEDYQTKRVDLALDVYEPGGFENVLKAYRDGRFSPPGAGGRPPKCQTIRSERDEDGETIYVGSRSSDKFYRGYEKGKQLLAASIATDRRRMGEDFDMGEWVLASVPVFKDDEVTMCRLWDWFRHELELKPKTAELPEDVIDRRDQYFAGSYPYLGSVLQDVDPQAFVVRRERGPQLDLALALATVRRQYGNTLFTALTAHHGDIGAVWSKVVGREHNKNLLRAGVLLVDHESY